MEHFIAKTMQPDPLFVWTDWRTETDEHGVAHRRCISHSYDEAHLARALRHLRDSVVGPRGDAVQKAFTDAWFEDPGIRVYNHVDFLPYNGVYDPARHNGSCYNLFQGYNPNIEAPLPDGVDPEKYRCQMLRPFFELGCALFEGSRQFLDFFLKSIAFVIQNPQRPVRHARRGVRAQDHRGHERVRGPGYHVPRG